MFCGGLGGVAFQFLRWARKKNGTIGSIKLVQGLLAGTVHLYIQLVFLNIFFSSDGRNSKGLQRHVTVPSWSACYLHLPPRKDPIFSNAPPWQALDSEKPAAQAPCRRTSLEETRPNEPRRQPDGFLDSPQWKKTKRSNGFFGGCFPTKNDEETKNITIFIGILTK